MIYVEEGMVTMFANFDKVLVDLTEDMEEDRKKEIKKMLFTLHRDPAKHKEKVDNLISQIEAMAKNEY